jgi:hypothetical protein
MTKLTRSSRCPVCEGIAKTTRQWSRADVVQSFSNRFGCSFPEYLSRQDYEIQCCCDCSLLFSDPMRPGDFEFYEFATSLANYYNPDRWEWHAVVKIIAQCSAPRVLEIGCGTGHFMNVVKKAVPQATAIGLDNHRPSIEARPMDCNIVEGGDAHFGDDLWTCKTCGHERYPEVFKCPRGTTPLPTKKSSRNFGTS